MRGTIRSLEQITIDEFGESAAQARAHIQAAVPAGYELISAVATQSRGGGDVSAHGIARSTATREIEAHDFGALRTATPEGWQLISVRSD